MPAASRIARWLFGIGCLGLGAWLVADGLRAEVSLIPDPDSELPATTLRDTAASLIGGGLLILIGAIALATELAALAAIPLHAFIDAIYLPGGRADKPTLNLKLPAYYREQDRPNDALAEYRKILRHHPDTLEAWLGALDLLVLTFEDTAAARRLYARGRRRFRRDAEKLAALESHWQSLGVR